MSRAEQKPNKKPKKKSDDTDHQLVIDEARGWVFDDEEALYAFFKPSIEKVEIKLFTEEVLEEMYEDELERTLEDPDEIWANFSVLEESYPVYLFFRKMKSEDVTQIAVCYCIEDEPTFIYTYFCLDDEKEIENLRSDNLIYDRAIKEVFKGAIEGDSLSEGDELSIGLYQAMITLRPDSDIKEEDFKAYIDLREESIEEPDEIWRSMDSYGNHLVYFIREYEDSESGENFFYVVITLEDKVSDSNVLLFSFPTNEESLVERYRKGENLQAEEVTQESSH